jgi:Tfp pilus assembly protein PilF/SAM-dependent methyltransferase
LRDSDEANQKEPFTMSFDLHQNFASAVTLHQAGRLSEAEGIYRNILAIDPRHSDSLHLLGVIALQVGRHEVAVDLIGQAINDNKRSPEYRNNMGVALRELGRRQEAVEQFKHAVKLKPDYADAHNNLGLTARDLGDSAEAEQRYRRVLSISPNHADAHYNLAIELAEQRKFWEAEEHCRQAVSGKPGFAAAWFNLGLVSMWQGKLAEAVDAYRQALALKPDYVEVYTNLATALVTAEEFPAALAALRCALALKETSEARLLAAHCIRHLKNGEEASAASDLILRALAEGWDRPVDLAQVCAFLVKRNPVIWGCVVRANNAWPQRLPTQELFGDVGLAALADDQLLRCFLESTPVWDIQLERVLTAARAALLERAVVDAASATADESATAFFCALARQCFINEYIFACGDDELAMAAALRERLTAALASGAAIPALWVPAVAAYFPLSSLPDAGKLLERASSASWPDAVAGVLTQQVSEPREEQELRAVIPRLTDIEHSVSLLVQQQYEENPYPRWVRMIADLIPKPVDQHFRTRFHSPAFRELGRSADIDMLIAGCGTGQHPFQSALTFSGVQILAVDLSLASLAYAVRKSRAAGLTNVDYAQADILKLGSIGRTFDIIEASGVLHHMADPMAAWRLLLSLLRPRGLMHLGFYSELGRTDVVAARQFIAERGYGRSADDIRRSRQELLAVSDRPPYHNILGFSDFSSTSGCRDLLFHVQEHVLTLPAIKAFLVEHDLEFLGFDLSPQQTQAFREKFSDEGAILDLDLWHIFETENPATFRSMYQFWVQKRG